MLFAKRKPRASNSFRRTVLDFFVAENIKSKQPANAQSFFSIKVYVNINTDAEADTDADADTHARGRMSVCYRAGRRLAGRVPFKDRFKGPFKGPFKGRNRAASAEQLEVMQSYNSQETTIFFCEKPKFVASRRSERKQAEVEYSNLILKHAK